MNQLKTIWIIDDTYEDLYIAERILKKTNAEFKVVAFQYPEIAYRQLLLYHEYKQPLPDAIILDLSMPVMSGFDFLEATSKQIHNHPPVFILTSSSDKRDKLHAQKFVQVKHLFTKPLTRQMVEQIKNALYKVAVFTFIALPTT